MKFLQSRGVHIFLLLSVVAAAASATVPDGITVQGQLVDNAGDPLPAGFKSFTFRIFDAATGGTQIWEETRVVNTNDDGLWTVRLGTTTPLSETDFPGSERWLEITVDDGVNPPETLSRVEITSQAFVYRAATSDQADNASTADNADLLDGLNSSSFAPTAHGHQGLWTQSGSFYYYNGGNVGLGTSTPSSRLHVVGTAHVTSSLTVDGNINIGSTPRYFVIPGVAMQPTDQGETYIKNSLGFLQPAAVLSTVTFYAGVHLPDGATVTALECNFRQSATPGSVAVSLVRGNQAAAITTTMASVSYLASSPSDQTLTDNTITAGVINNQIYQYFISGNLAHIAPGGTSSDVRLYSIQITYTVDEPLP